MDTEALQLKTIELRSRPFGKRAIAWSADAELAVAADDSVLVFMPQFPRFHVDFAEQRRKQAAAAGSSWLEGIDKIQPLKPQYADGQRRIPISLPRVSPRVNFHLFATSGVDSPYDGWVDHGTEDSSGAGNGEGSGSEDDFEDDALPDDEIPKNAWRKMPNLRDRNNPFNVTGAGSGLFTSVGSSLNQVLSLAWSPPIGRNDRCLLAVHSAAGYIAVYGEPLVAAADEQRGHHLGSMYSTEGWEVLWGVGERLSVPKQATWGECYRSFAWSQEIWPGKALMAVTTDDLEIAILAVHARVSVDWEDGVVGAGWQIEEVARFDAKGPHPPGHVHDLDYVPDKSTVGLSFGPSSSSGEDSKELLLGYISRGYVGFRKVTVRREWFREGDVPFVDVAETDSDGRCMFLAPDAFMSFEDNVWTVQGQKICRGVIATPMVPKIFEVNMSIETSRIQPHALTQCGCVYPGPEEISRNPIQDLVVHPHLQGSSIHQPPVYTLIRLSATQASRGWYETTVPSTSSEAGPNPKWAVAVSRILDISMPKHMLGKTGAEGLGIGDGDDDEDEDKNDENDNEMDDDDEDEDAEGEEDVDVMQNHLKQMDAPASSADDDSIPIWRARLYGIALSPGGGCSAVVWAKMAAAVVERGAWHQARSTLSFHCHATPWAEEEDKVEVINGPHIARLSTEAKMFEWMYGRGPDVAGVTRPKENAEGIPVVKKAFEGIASSVGRDRSRQSRSESWEESLVATLSIQALDDTTDRDIALSSLQPALDGVNREDRDPHGDSSRRAGTCDGHQAQLPTRLASDRVDGGQLPLDVLIRSKVCRRPGAVTRQRRHAAAEDRSHSAFLIQLPYYVETTAVARLLAGCELLLTLDLQDHLYTLKWCRDGSHWYGGEEAGGGNLCYGERPVPADLDEVKRMTDNDGADASEATRRERAQLCSTRRGHSLGLGLELLLGLWDVRDGAAEML
ncbi:hypothetical protein PpBr36_00103 [Pyricularia pennisetigena]|uniref:hypothetical protein n=1 Tax=Pyricularia pennisetigena TaxID=1578925 RepID=UPI0011523242|nr:hypothetical protein PpBr36_00103 [Pyricularia pennisetigena]TLS29179.1 hypothetical protein PpBr36_00103 [Pyricularia pennisetigena]